MKSCPACSAGNPDQARYCMACGHQLPEAVDVTETVSGRYGSLWLSLALSIGLSLILMFIFRLPVFLLVGFLPLLWSFRKKV